MGKKAEPKLNVRHEPMPVHWASYLINDDASGIGPEEKKIATDYFAKAFGWHWDVVSCADDTFIGQFEGKLTELTLYTMHYMEPVDVYEIEHTDTFGGEANYSWVRRETIRVAHKASKRSIMIHAMRAIGMSGYKIKESEEYADVIKVTWRNTAQIAFITYKEESYVGRHVITGLGKGKHKGRVNV